MLRKTTIVFALGILLATGTSACLQAHERDVHSQPTIQALSPIELKRLIDRGAMIHVYDANGRDSYMEGHVPGAKWVAYDAVAETDLPEAKHEMLVFYCWNRLCGASHQAAEQALSLGYNNVWRMPAGIEGWRAASLPIVSGSEPN